MNDVTSITRYFRQSLIDSERICPDDLSVLKTLKVDTVNGHAKKAKGEMLNVGPACWGSGHFMEEEARRIFEVVQSVKGGPGRHESAEIVLFPRVDLLKSEGGKRSTFKRKVFIPMVVFAQVDRQGKLSPAAHQPWIPRIWLSPNEGQNTPIGDYTALDEYLTQTPFEAVDNWSELRAYAEGMIGAVTGMWFDQDLHPDYVNSQQAVVLVDPPIVGAKERLIGIYDKIIDGGSPSTLYRAFASVKDAPQAALMDGAEHLRIAHDHMGQMTGEFPLSPKQRIAMHHFLHQDNEGEILAVNGPPGTGKTTLIRSVVATVWVSAALSESEPPLIVAASNNNQAVTNILESFARIDESDAEPDLAGRWLPDINTYGLYCCSGYKANDRNPYAYAGPANEGLMSTLQNAAFLKCAQALFLASASNRYGAHFTDMKKAKRQLLSDLKQTVDMMRNGLNEAERLEEIRALIIKKFGSSNRMLEMYARTQQKLHTMEAEIQTCRTQLDRLYETWKQRPRWAKFIFIKWMLRKAHAQENAQFLNRLDIALEATDDDAVEIYFKTLKKKATQKRDRIKTELDRVEKLRNKYQAHRDAMKHWLASQGEKNWSEQNFNEMTNAVCDRILRFKAFKLATHYWEARWLEETRDFVESYDKDTKSPVKIRRKWRRYAKLTPCFVSTFYMLPTFFTAWERQEETWMDIPLFGEIDLLVVDEAGQALPEVAAAGFALAKRALVVGDTDQIEPVWGVPASIDRANLRLFGLLRSDDAEKNYADFWLQSGLPACCGNVMRVAQRQCRYHQFSQLQRGLYLTEHRRCYDSIIGYCNDLVYKGVLELLRGEPLNGCPWPQMGFFAVNGKSTTRGSSRINETEANAISQWIVENGSTIVSYARQMDARLESISDDAVLQKAVGIVTPFSRQAALIEKRLTRCGVPRLTVGTVHRLQGDERYIVIFSCVYGAGDRGIRKFYDRSHNMLNVAVSRAKDCFLVFGHPDIFGVDGDKRPSSMLRERLMQLPILG